MKFKLDLGGRELTAEINNLAEQTSGSVFLQYGETLVLATCVMSDKERESLDFFPLTVNYEEKFYAAGKIRGPRYIRREARPSDEAICNARLVDRAIRPLFPGNLNREVQVVVTVLSWDGQNEPDILGLLASSIALSISDIPWQGPVATVRIGKIGEQFILNPTYAQREESEIDIVFAAKSGQTDLLINMLEGNFEEVGEETILAAYQFSKPFLKKLLDFQKEISAKVGKEKVNLAKPEIQLELEKEIKEFLENKLEEEEGRMEKLDQLKEDLINFIQEKYPERMGYALKFFEKEIGRIIHENVIKNERRPDGRKLTEIRKISCQAGLIPRTHGSGLFCRGQTKSLSILTLGAPGDVQILEGMEIVGKKRFMHHYNFPPYCSGEVKPIRGPGRREIGHGVLAEKALLPLIPSFGDFPYTIRVVTEILSSNGSTSMASVSSSSLALMDAGVPILRPAAGIAMGLMQDKEGNYKILTDIQGPEDHHGDMDLKVAGTKNGVTAIQMDVKFEGISEKILRECLGQAKKARSQILEKMKEVISKPRLELSPFAPRILTIQINPEKIREVIGPGGKVINKIIKECGVSIDVEETGKIFVTAEKEEAAKKAIAWINDITREVKVGEIFQGKVKKILDFGAFIEILPGQEGLLHISKIAPYRVERIEDFFKVGDVISVKVISVDEQGRINLSLVRVRNSGEDAPNYPKPKH